jgi:mRNA interferase RelE/StbE
VTYRIEFRPSARKAFNALPGEVKRRVDARILALADDPRPAGAKKLAGAAGLFRIRVGDYRVVYHIGDAVMIVTVVKIGHRREVYRGG